MLRRLAFPLIASFVAATAAAGDLHVKIAVEPPQELAAIAVRGGDVVRSLSIRNGILTVPDDIPLPWSLGMLRFEAFVYTREDLDQKKPWLIRELGTLQGRLQRPSPKKEDRCHWLLQSSSGQIVEREFAVDETGAFRITLPAGNYQGAALGPASATRIRSGIVIKPGQTTDLGVVVAEAAIPVSLRVVDARTGKPVAGARVVWDPPNEILNSDLLEKLYARRWSGMTDRTGLAEIAPVGPLPHSVRWRIETKDYAPTLTARVQLKDPRRFVLPDVRLRRAPAAVVRVRFARRDEEGLEDCMLVAGEIRDPTIVRYSPVGRTRLLEGESRFEFTTYSRKRVWVENKSGRTVFYRDFEVTGETTLIDLLLRPVEIHGRVTQRGKAVGDVLVTLADSHNGQLILAQTRTDDDGEYRLTTWPTVGEIHLYTIPLANREGSGKNIGNASARVELEERTDVEVNLEVPAAGFSIRVVDAQSGVPIPARCDIRGGGQMSMVDTDAYGRLDVSGFKEGRAKLNIKAKGYRAAQIEVAISPETPEAVVRLERAKAVTGKVVTLNGTPIARARVLGGYPHELDSECFYRATTNALGQFELDPPPSPGTTFYVIAAGHALGVTTLRPDQPNTVVLHPPSTFAVSLRQNNQTPEKVYLVMAAPAGEDFISLGALEELAALSGMDGYQLCGSSVEGDVILPEFLGPGRYDLFLARRGGNPFIYQRLGTITTPLARNVVLSIPK